MTVNLPTVHEIAKTIDHALLKPQLTMVEVRDGLELAKEYDVFSVCVRPADVKYAADYLRGTDVKVGTVVGFPHGSVPTIVKVFETRQAFVDGATEIDMVLNVGWLKSGMDIEVEADIFAVVDVAKALGVDIVKVILETAYLTEEEIVRACKLAERAGVNFVKTSTGFAGEGATIPNVKRMRENVSESVEVKASGGVTDLDTLLSMRELGVTRFGTSATPVILNDLKSRIETGNASAEIHVDEY